ncbi:hypothetical protein AB0H00_28890 [Nocardia sp. NPDC023852]|uniref:hypothetical protein n=1 Tax=Nocardia sp. NPDC023852 TaxID=3154697 RepID=UPI003408641F
MAYDLSVGLVANTHPQGGIGASNTAEKYVVALHRMVTTLSEPDSTVRLGI